MADATPESWPAISALLDEALALPAEARDKFVQSLEGERAQHRETLRSLLANAAGVETDAVLATLPRLTRVAERGPLTELAAGASIGPYRLISELGTGGMGAVWLAERSDGALKRKVALKLPRLVWARGLAERMARERDILASLEHPHIARLYDAGVDQHGRPYLALEYVEGQPIDEYCNARGVTVRQKLDLLLQVCSAVAFAHSRLVVHRDLKPSNILVTADGQARLLDFGIAKLVESDSAKETQLTQLAGRALTLDYASPEQIKGEPIGTTSDVYSLGVVAYELLTGARPYKLKRGSAAELEEAIATADPPKASETATDLQAKKALRGDLDAILNKALKKAAGERYPTVDALAQDLDRHINSEPVSAQPDAFAYRARKFLRRYRVQAGAMSAVMLALAIGLGAAIWQGRAATKQASLATKAAAREDAVKVMYVEALSAVAAWDGVRLNEPQAVAKLLTQKLEDMEKRLANRPESILAVQEAVSVHLPFMGDFEGSLAVGDRYLKGLQASGADRARILRAFLANGRALLNLGRLEQSAATLQQALALEPDSDSSLHYAVRLRVELANVLLELNRRVEAIDVTEAAARQAKQAGPSVTRRFEVLQVQSRLYQGYDDVSALALAEEAHRSFEGEAGFTKQPAERGASLLGLGRAQAAAGQAAAGEASLREAQRLFDEAYGVADRDAVLVTTLRAGALAQAGRFPEALELLGERRQTVQARPGPDTLGNMRALAAKQLGVELAFGDVKGALSNWRSSGVRVDQLRRREASTFFPDYFRLLMLNGQAPECLRLAEDRLNSFDAKRRVALEGLWLSLVQAECRLATGHADAAMIELTALMETLTKQGAGRTWLRQEAAELRAVALARTGATAQAVEQLQSLASASGQMPPAPPSVVARAESALRRAEVSLAAGKRDEARTFLETALTSLQGQHRDSPRERLARNMMPSR
ncbi:MAG: protein kinase domain-containing protein [bacterium]